MKLSGVQLARAMVPPGRADAEQLGGGPVVVGREHGAEDRRYGVERAVGEGQRLGVALQKLDVEPFGGRACASALEQGGHVVHPDHGAAVARGGDRRVAAAGCDVEHAPAGAQVGRVAELLGHEHDARADRSVIAARPGLLLALLDRAEVE